jgi:hypothetical protein
MTVLREFFESYYRLRPVNATFTGVHAYDDRLPDWSPEGLESATCEMRDLRRALSAARTAAGTVAGTAASLRDVAFRDRELAISFLDIQIAEIECAHFHRGNPSLAIGEAAFGIISLMTRAFATVATRAEACAARLSAVPAFLEGARRGLAPGLGAGIPDEWRRKCLRECEGADRLLAGGIERWIALESIPASPARHLTQAAVSARTAVARFAEWLRGAPSGGEERYAVGEDFFDLLLDRGHWCQRSRAELSAAAGDALDAALDVLHQRSSRAGGWAGVQARLADTHPTVADYLLTYQRVWDACRRQSDTARLLTWPEYPIRYVPIPVHTRDAAPFLYYLHYRSPAPLDNLPVHDYVVPPIEPEMDADEQERRLRATNTGVITLNHVVHHGAIGHHVQNYYAYHGPSEIGRVAAVDCASRIGMFLGGTMAEGWACYATDLMDEQGFLTADESLSQQHTRARLIARAVVDIGLHDRSLSFEDAVAVYRDRIGMPVDAARAEACKNSMFPGTAIMYWIGADALHRLRKEQVGGDMSLQQFHDRVLSFGSIPVPLVARVWQ